jgi:phosphatidate cytidylyltransferase
MAGKEAIDQPAGMVGGRNLPLAIVVGVGLAVLFLGSLFWRPAAFTVVIVLLAIAACVEVARVVRSTGVQLITPVLVATSVAILPAAYVYGPLGQVAGVALLVAGSVTWLLVDRGRREVVRTLSTTVLFGLWVPFLASYALLLVARPEGPTVVLAVIGAAVLTDIGGYVFGVAFGRHKVAPSVSPNKSWEGLLGGLVVAGALAAAVLPVLGDSFTPVSAAGLAVACGVAAFVGDLVESMIKRDLDLKDLGDLLPGHGGILDRVDGILFALPVGYYLLVLLD